MKIYSTIARGRKRHCFALAQLSLDFDSAPPNLPALLSPTLAETHLARRFGVSLALARALAENANLGGRA